LVDSKLHKDSFSRRLPIITCACGYEILILPDVKIMSQAIEKHVLEHKNKGATDSEADKIEFELIAQLFKKVAKSDF
jgi:hypothetical protein